MICLCRHARADDQTTLKLRKLLLSWMQEVCVAVAGHLCDSERVLFWDCSLTRVSSEFTICFYFILTVL